VWVHFSPGCGGSWRGDPGAGLNVGFNRMSARLCAPAIARGFWAAGEGYGRMGGAWL
jgi:hypothetical protein